MTASFGNLRCQRNSMSHILSRIMQHSRSKSSSSSSHIEHQIVMSRINSTQMPLRSWLSLISFSCHIVKVERECWDVTEMSRDPLRCGLLHLPMAAFLCGDTTQAVRLFRGGLSTQAAFLFFFLVTARGIWCMLQWSLHSGCEHILQ
jgi:hypothetical protein